MNALDRAIEAAGGVSSLANTIGLKQNVVSNWRLRGQVPAERVLAVEAATGVSRHDLRPDVFGEAPDELRRTPAANEGDAAGASSDLKAA